MTKSLIPRFVLYQSVYNPSQYFYVVLMDLPADTEAYPDPSGIEPKLEGTAITYKTEDYNLPDHYDGETITYLLKPYMAISENGIPNILHIDFDAKQSKKKGDTGGVASKQINTNPYIPYYICKDRVFVIQSDTNRSTYFVGTLVDFPSNQIPNNNLKIVQSTEIEIDIKDEQNPSQTCIVCNHTPAQYSGGENPTASYTSIYVKEHNTDSDRGVLLGDGIDLYKHATQPDYGNNTNQL